MFVVGEPPPPPPAGLPLLGGFPTAPRAAQGSGGRAAQRYGRVLAVPAPRAPPASRGGKGSRPQPPGAGGVLCSGSGRLEWSGLIPGRVPVVEHNRHDLNRGASRQRIHGHGAGFARLTGDSPARGRRQPGRDFTGGNRPPCKYRGASRPSTGCVMAPRSTP